MSTSPSNMDARAIGLIMLEDGFDVVVTGGRHYHIPYSCYPRLAAAHPDERMNFEICAHGRLLHWPMIDEDVAIEHVLAGKYPVKLSCDSQQAAESRPDYGTGKNT